MNIYFFFKNENNSGWYDFTLEAWSENNNTYRKGIKGSSFTLLEKLHIHLSKDPLNKIEGKKYHCARLDHEFGSDLCTGYEAHSPEEFLKGKTKNEYSPMTEINHNNFKRFKKVIFEIYRQYPALNYSEQLLKVEKPCSVLFEWE